MINDKKGYSYNDLTIVPAEISRVSSRSECNPFIKDNLLPIFTAPMASVVDANNSEVFLNNGIIPIIPRNINIETRIKLMNNQRWVALSLKEFEDLFIDNYLDRINDDKINYYICVDIANGHMMSLYEKCIKAKKLAINGKYKLTIMTGNIANFQTYKWIFTNCIYLNDKNEYECAIDYIRVGIGGGSGCFVDGTKIITKNGLKNIEDINEGELVLTIDGSYQRVINTTRFKSNELIKINNEVTSTINHKFFVINKEDKNKVNENNLQKYGYWLEANKLDKEKHLLIKIS